MAYTRCFFSPGGNNIIWPKGKLEEELFKINKKIDGKNKQNFKLLFEWMINGEVFNAGSSIILLYKILSDQRHTRAYFLADIRAFFNYSEKHGDNLLSDSDILCFNDCTVRIIQRFDQIEKATKLIFKEKSNSISIRQSDCDRSLEKIEDIKPLVEPTLKIDSTKEAKRIFKLATSGLIALDDDWLHADGYLNKIIKPYLVSFYDLLTSVNKKMEREFNESSIPIKSQIDYSCFEKRNNKDIKVIHENRILYDLLQDIFKNFWQYVVPAVLKSNRLAELNFSYDLKPKRRIIIKIQDNGPGIEKNKLDLMNNDSKLKEFETFDCKCVYENIDNGKGTLVTLTMYTTEVTYDES